MSKIFVTYNVLSGMPYLGSESDSRWSQPPYKTMNELADAYGHWNDDCPTPIHRRAAVNQIRDIRHRLSSQVWQAVNPSLLSREEDFEDIERLNRHLDRLVAKHADEFSGLRRELNLTKRRAQQQRKKAS